MSRDGSDEAYVIRPCNMLLGDQAATITSLGGCLATRPSTDDGSAAVDGYWAGHRLVVVYRKLQHEQPASSTALRRRTTYPQSRR
jgi:hypothetical protein